MSRRGAGAGAVGNRGNRPKVDNKQLKLFYLHCIYLSLISIVLFTSSEIEQSLAAAISDRATDEVLEALTRYRRGLGIAESPSVLLDEPQTPDIVRSRSSHVSNTHTHT